MIQTASVTKTPPQVPPSPWDLSSIEMERYLRDHLRIDALIIAALDLKNPQPDEVILVAGDASTEKMPSILQHWPLSDIAFQEAAQNGTAQTEIRHSSCRELIPDTNTNTNNAATILYLTLPANLPADNSWFIAAARKHGPFRDNEINLLRQLLSQWAEHFNAPAEPKLLRLFVGQNQRIILSGPPRNLQPIDQDVEPHQWLQHILNVEKQRWVEPQSNHTHDLTLSINNTIQWVRLHHRNPLDTPAGANTYLELRALPPGEMTAVNEIADHRVARSLALIHERYSESLTLEEISSAVGISLFHFHRLFSQHVGVTPKQYLLQKQLQVARWLLRTRRTPIGRIAVLTGFASHGHFTSTFSRMVGMSPSAYRDQATQVEPEL